MAASRRALLERRMQELGTLTTEEIARLLQVWVTQPEKLWGEPVSGLGVVPPTWVYHVRSEQGLFIYRHEFSRPHPNCSASLAGHLITPRQRHYQVVADWVCGELERANITVIARQPYEASTLYVSAGWTTKQGIRLRAVGRRAEPRLRVGLSTTYGTRAIAVATRPELVQMYLTFVLPPQLLKCFRNLK